MEGSDIIVWLRHACEVIMIDIAMDGQYWKRQIAETLKDSFCIAVSGNISGNDEDVGICNGTGSQNSFHTGFASMYVCYGVNSHYLPAMSG
jgi:hypothetical protein